MRLIRTRGKYFQGLQQFDILLPMGPLCIVGPNMSGKTSTARAIHWSLTATFPYPDMRFVKDMVLPADIDLEEGLEGVGVGVGVGAKDEALATEAVIKKVSKAKKGKKSRSRKETTVVQTWYGVSPQAESQGGGEQVFIVTRAFYRGKVYTRLQDEKKVYSFYGTEAQEMILHQAKIPDIGSLNERLKIFSRTLWYGVGQEISIFHAKGTERKKILESVNPSTKFGAWEKEGSDSLKAATKHLDELRIAVSEQLGGVRAKREELAKKLEVLALPEVAPEMLRATAELFLKEIRSNGQKTTEEIDRHLEKDRRYQGLVENALTARLLLKRLDDECLDLEKQGHKLYDLSRLSASEVSSRLAIESLNGAKESVLEIETRRNAEQAFKNEIVNLQNKIDSTSQNLSSLVALEAQLSMGGESAAKILACLGVEPPLYQGALVSPEINDLLRLSQTFSSDVCRSLSLQEISDDKVATAMENLLSQKGGDKAETRRGELEGNIKKLSQGILDLRTVINDRALQKSAAVLTASEVTSLNEKIGQKRAEAKEVASLLERIKIQRTLAEALLTSLGNKNNSETLSKSNEAFSKAGEIKALGALENSVTNLKKVLSLDFSNTVSPETIALLCEAALSLTGGLDLAKSEVTEANEVLLKISANKNEKAGQIISLRKDLKHTKDKIVASEKSRLKADEAAVKSDVFCGECGSELSSDHIVSHLEALKSKQETLENEIDQLEKEASLEDASYDEAFSAHESKKSDLAILQRLFLDLTQACEGYLSQTRELGEKEGLTSPMQALWDEVESQSASLVSALDEKETTLGIIHGKISALDQRLKVLLGLSPEEGDVTTLVSEHERKAEDKETSLRRELKVLDEEHAARVQARNFLAETSLKYLSLIGWDEGKKTSRAHEVLAERLSLERGNVKELSTKMSLQKEQLSSASAETRALDAELRDALGVAPEESIAAAIRVLSEALKIDLESVQKTLFEARAHQAKLQSKVEAKDEVRSRISEELVDKSEIELESLIETTSKNQTTLRLQREVSLVVGDVQRLTSEVKTLEENLDAYKESIDEQDDQIAALSTFKGLLSSNGDARTFALANDIATIVYTTNSYLESLALSKPLAIDLKLEKDDDQTPIIDIRFWVDGSSSGRILPSESQRKIVGLCMDLALMKLGMREGFIFIDEPETGLDEVNRTKFAQFLKQVSPQTILITNTASSGFEHTLTTEDIKNSAKGVLTNEDFDLDSMTKESGVKEDDAKEAEGFSPKENNEAKSVTKNRAKKGSPEESSDVTFLDEKLEDTDDLGTI